VYKLADISDMIGVVRVSVISTSDRVVTTSLMVSAIRRSTILTVCIWCWFRRIGDVTVCVAIWFVWSLASVWLLV